MFPRMFQFFSEDVHQMAHPEDSILNAFHMIKNAGTMFLLYYIEPIFVTFYLQQPKKSMAHQHNNQQISSFIAPTSTFKPLLRMCDVVPGYF